MLIGRIVFFLSVFTFLESKIWYLHWPTRQVVPGTKINRLPPLLRRGLCGGERLLSLADDQVRPDHHHGGDPGHGNNILIQNGARGLHTRVLPYILEYSIM